MSEPIEEFTVEGEIAQLSRASQAFLRRLPPWDASLQSDTYVFWDFENEKPDVPPGDLSFVLRHLSDFVVGLGAVSRPIKWVLAAKPSSMDRSTMRRLTHSHWDVLAASEGEDAADRLLDRKLTELARGKDVSNLVIVMITGDAYSSSTLESIRQAGARVHLIVGIPNTVSSQILSCATSVSFFRPITQCNLVNYGNSGAERDFAKTRQNPDVWAHDDFQTLQAPSSEIRAAPNKWERGRPTPPSPLRRDTPELPEEHQELVVREVTEEVREEVREPGVWEVVPEVVREPLTREPLTPTTPVTRERVIRERAQLDPVAVQREFEIYIFDESTAKIVASTWIALHGPLGEVPRLPPGILPDRLPTLVYPLVFRVQELMQPNAPHLKMIYYTISRMIARNVGVDASIKLCVGTIKEFATCFWFAALMERWDEGAWDTVEQATGFTLLDLAKHSVVNAIRRSCREYVFGLNPLIVSGREQDVKDLLTMRFSHCPWPRAIQELIAAGHIARSDNKLRIVNCPKSLKL